MSEPHVRLATSADVNDLIHLVKEAHTEEHIGPSSSLSEARVFEQILRAMRGDAVIGVIANEDEIESSCFLDIASPWYSDTPLINILWCYTRPDFRRSSNSKSIMSWVRKQAERLNIPLQMEVPTTEENKPRLALCERLFGAPTGRIFVHMPNPESPTEINDVEVRPALPSDEPDILDAIRQLAVEDGTWPPNEELAIPCIRGAIEGDGMIGIIRPKEELEALVFLKIMSPWYSNDLYLDEYLLYCKPEFRKSKDARSLVQFAKRQADRLEVPLRIGVTSRADTARKLQLYQRLLNAPSATHFIYRPEVA